MRRPALYGRGADVAAAYRAGGKETRRVILRNGSCEAAASFGYTQRAIAEHLANAADARRTSFEADARVCAALRRLGMDVAPRTPAERWHYPMEAARHLTRRERLP